jgi:hypothetical protein
MSHPTDQVDELKLVCPALKEFSEGGVNYFFLPQLKLPTGCAPAQVDCLLCPNSPDGYVARLWFSQIIHSPRSLNWNGQRVIEGKQWYAYSWQLQNGHRLINVLNILMNALR